jgi:hypothetical protein
MRGKQVNRSFSQFDYLPPLDSNNRLFNHEDRFLAGLQSPFVMRRNYIEREESTLSEHYVHKGIRMSGSTRLPSERPVEFFSKRTK